MTLQPSPLRPVSAPQNSPWLQQARRRIPSAELKNLRYLFPAVGSGACSGSARRRQYRGRAAVEKQCGSADEKQTRRSTCWRSTSRKRYVASPNICYFALSPEDEARDAAHHIYDQGKQSPLLFDSTQRAWRSRGERLHPGVAKTGRRHRVTAKIRLRSRAENGRERRRGYRVDWQSSRRQRACAALASPLAV
ncbi:LppC putative lipoprotein [Salmonella sp. NCTC 11881]|nr:LppC putative lipoprotein [Salmonella sp. NCTC 11881]